VAGRDEAQLGPAYFAGGYDNHIDDIRHRAYGHSSGYARDQVRRPGRPWMRSTRWENRTLRYKVVLQHSEEGYSVSVPGLPGCWSQGATEEEAMANIKDAVIEYLAAVNDLFPDAEVREIEVAV
jgi:predicted RNase H-like HicB family nuclease